MLYRLLREQGDAAELVIGLPKNPADKSAHAWVELDGVDVGPPPGPTATNRWRDSREHRDRQFELLVACTREHDWSVALRASNG